MFGINVLINVPQVFNQRIDFSNFPKVFSTCKDDVLTLMTSFSGKDECKRCEYEEQIKSLISSLNHLIVHQDTTHV